MAHSEACQLFIEEQINEGLAAGKTPYSIGKELTAMVERFFEVSISENTFKDRAYRMQKKIGGNQPNPPTPSIPAKFPQNQVKAHGGARDGAGRPQKYDKPVEPYSCAMQMARIAISQLSRITKDDPKRQVAFQTVTDWINENS